MRGAARAAFRYARSSQFGRSIERKVLADIPLADWRIIDAVQPFTMTSPQRLFALLESLRYVVNAAIPGAVVECGVWRGGSMLAAALQLQRLHAQERHLYLFDTFAGMPRPTGLDVSSSGESAAHILRRTRRRSGHNDAWAIASVDEVRARLLASEYPPRQLHLIEGMVERTVPQAAPDEIAVLRLDTDWYASTLYELEHLYPRIAPGGILIIDDYGDWLGARRAVDEYFGRLPAPVLLQRIDRTGRLVIRPPQT